MCSAYWKAQPAVSGVWAGAGPVGRTTPSSPAETQVRGLMVRRRWAAAVGLVVCLLLLHVVVPGLSRDGRAAGAAVTAAVDVRETGAASTSEAEGAGEPCPCEEDPSLRHLAARTPRAAGPAGQSAVPTGTPVADRGGTDIRAAGTGRRPGAVVSARNAVELQTFRC